MVSSGICCVHFVAVGNSISALISFPQQYVQAPEARPVPDERYPGSQQDRKDIATQTVRSSKPKDLRPPSPPSPSQTLNSSSLPPPMSDQDADPSLDVPTGVAMPYNIDWIFPRLRNPSKFWYVVSQFVVSAVGIFSKVVLSEYLTGRADLTKQLAQRHVYFWPRDAAFARRAYAPDRECETECVSESLD